jgi:hypothetical protein
LADFLIAYDLNAAGSPHKVFLDEAVNEGLLYVLSGSIGIDRLPNTTLWGQFANSDDCVKAFRRVAVRVATRTGRAVNVEKFIVTSMANLKFTSDVRVQPKPQWTGRTTFETSRLHQLSDPAFA